MGVFSTVIAGRAMCASTINVAGGVNQALSVDQSVPPVIIFTGVLTASITVTMPLVSGDSGATWIIWNNTSGSYTLTLQAATGGASVAVAQGKKCLLFWDGSALYAAETDGAAMGLAERGSNSSITALTGITGGIAGTGTFSFDKIQGNAAALALGRLTKTYPSDANYTASASEAANPWIEISAGVVTAGRNFVLPLTAGAVWLVYNVSGQTITFIGASGAGIAVATGKRAVLGTDGTNFVRFSADV